MTDIILLTIFCTAVFSVGCLITAAPDILRFLKKKKSAKAFFVDQFGCTPKEYLIDLLK